MALCGFVTVRAESVRKNGNELIRVTAKIPDFIFTAAVKVSIDKAIRDYYTQLAVTAAESALKNVGKKAEEEFSGLCERGERSKFRRYSCSFETSVSGISGNIVCIVTDTRIARAGSVLHFCRRSQLWNVSENTLIYGGKSNRFFSSLKPQNTKNKMPQGYDGAFFTDNCVIFFKNPVENEGYSEQKFNI